MATPDSPSGNKRGTSSSSRSAPGETQTAARTRAGASPRIGVSPTKSRVASGAGQPDEKYLAYMKALRVGRQRAKEAAAEHAAGSGQSSPVRLTPLASPRNLGGVQETVHTRDTPAGRGQRSAAAKGISGGEAKGLPKGRSGNGRRQKGSPHGAVADCPAARAASSSSDSSDSIDFEVRSIGHVRSFKKTPASAARRSANLEESTAEEIRDLHRFLHQSLSSAREEIATTSSPQVMGTGEGVILEADVGYKDGKSVFSPHGADQSHVEEDPQDKASKKIAELESMKAMIDQERTPTGKGTEGASRLSSVKDELKAQLSSIKAGLAESFESERGAEDVSSKVRSQLQSLHDTISNDDAQGDGGLKSPTSDGGQGALGAPRSSKREQLTAKLRSYQAQLRIAQSQGIARRMDEANGDSESWGSVEDVGSGKASAVGARMAKLQSDIKEVEENTKRIEATQTVADSSAAGSSGAMSNPPLESRAKNGDSSPHAGVFPRSDNFDDTPTDGAGGSGTKRSAAKTGMAPATLDHDIPIGEPGEEFPAGPLDENDPIVLAGERLRQANSYAGAFAGMMMLLAVCSFFFGIFMPFGFAIWAIALPLGMASGYFLRYCYPLPSSDGDSTMPQSLNWVSMMVIYVGSSLFFAGILAASASLSIAPIMDTAVCTGLTPPPNNFTTVPVFNRNSTNATLANDAKQGGADLNATSNFTTVPTETVTGKPPHPLSGLDAETLMKFGRCQGWNMCGDEGIKMLTCSQLKAFNDWNAVFFFLTSFLIPPFWLWIYYVISVRLIENAAAQDGDIEVLDCGLPACYKRVMDHFTAPAPADEDIYEDDEGSQYRGAPKFNDDGPYRTSSAGSGRANDNAGRGQSTRGARV